MKEEIYEKCEHKWETINETKEYIGTATGGMFSESVMHYKLVWIQKCEKCGKLNKVS